MKRIIAMLMALAMLTGVLAGCGSQETASAESAASVASEAPAPASEIPQEAPVEPEPVQEPTSVTEDTPAESAAEAPYEAVDIRVAAIKGPTGAGMVKLIDDAANGLTANNYTVELSADASEVVTKVIAGEYDIACLPTNSAAVVYQKTQGAVKLLALNTEGVLHILQNTSDEEPITDWAQLKGKTIYTLGQGANPEYVLDYVLSGHGIDPDNDITIQFCAAADEVVAACASGEASICMLPEPAVSTLSAKVEGFTEIFDLTEGWNEVVEDGSILTQGCVVVQTAFLEEQPEAVKKFLEEYEASTNFVTENNEAAAKLMAQYEIVPSEAVALKALPGCHIIFKAGQEMKDSIQGYYDVLFQADPTSIGGALPDDAFYVINP